jgi:hypothetical protein
VPSSKLDDEPWAVYAVENMKARLAQRRRQKITMVALARRIAVILHRIWVDGTVFEANAVPKIV